MKKRPRKRPRRRVRRSRSVPSTVRSFIILKNYPTHHRYTLQKTARGSWWAKWLGRSE